MTQYVLEWSSKSNGFHIQKLEDMLAANQCAFVKNTTHNYIVLMVGTKEVCHSMADNHRDRLLQRVERVTA